MKLKAQINQVFPRSMYKVEIIDLDNKDSDWYTNSIQSIRSTFYSQYLWTAKIRAKKAMKKMYKAYNFSPEIHEISL